MRYVNSKPTLYSFLVFERTQIQLIKQNKLHLALLRALCCTVLFVSLHMLSHCKMATSRSQPSIKNIKKKLYISITGIVFVNLNVMSCPMGIDDLGI